MFTAVVWLMIVVSIFMVIIVLVQKSKGGGLNQSFASQTQIMGVRKSTDFVEKATWYLASAIFVLALASAALIPSNSEVNGDSGLDQVIENQRGAQQMAAPQFDAQAPAADAEPAAQAEPAAEQPAE